MRIYIKDGFIAKTIYTAGYDIEEPLVDADEVIEMEDDDLQRVYKDGKLELAVSDGFPPEEN